MAELTISNDMRVGAIGRTRCGKTFLMMHLLEGQKRVLIVDDKQRVRKEGYHLTSDPNAALIEDKTILRPNGRLPSSFWEEVLEHFSREGGGLVYIDELAEQCDQHGMNPGLRSIFRMGGELGVGLWWAAQSATEISNTAIRQSDVLILFLNIGSSDRDKIIKTAGDLGEVTAHLKLYQFVVYESANQGYDPNHIPVYKLPAPREPVAV